MQRLVVFYIYEQLSLYIYKGNDMKMNCIDELFEFVEAGDIEFLKESLENGISVNVRNRYGETLLMQAVWFGYKEIVKFLIDQGADVTIKNENETALYLAEIEGCEDIIEIIKNQN